MFQFDKPFKGVHLLIDADIVAYRAAASAEADEEWIARSREHGRPQRSAH